MNRPPKPEPLQCECGEAGTVYWSQRTVRSPCWIRGSRCLYCHATWYNHGMTHAERLAYLANGCAISGCEKAAVHIDHDHSICPQSSHSCEKCRRGALCHGHNILSVAIIDQLRAGLLHPVLDYMGIDVAITPKGKAA